MHYCGKMTYVVATEVPNKVLPNRLDQWWKSKRQWWCQWQFNDTCAGAIIMFLLEHNFLILLATQTSKQGLVIQCLNAATWLNDCQHDRLVLVQHIGLFALLFGWLTSTTTRQCVLAWDPGGGEGGHKPSASLEPVRPLEERKTRRARIFCVSFVRSGSRPAHREQS